MKTYKGLILNRYDIPDNGIFVFGANTEGRHGKGAALTAYRHFGAEYGNPQGPQGRSYAIITKDLGKPAHPSIPRVYIEMQISGLYAHAYFNKESDFYIAYGIGPNLNGYSPKEMADMFSSYPIPDNIVFEEKFSHLLTPTLAT